MSTGTRKTEVASQSYQGEAKRNEIAEKESTRSHTVLCHSRSSENAQITLGSERGGIGTTKKKTRKNDCPVP